MSQGIYRSNRLIALPLLFFLSCLNVFVSPAPLDTVPAVVVLSLKQLEETDHVLDKVATQAWPGWTDYRTVPFLFHFPNGLQVLAGHPSPPTEFHPLARISCRGMEVFCDDTRMSDPEMPGPLHVYGGYTSLVGEITCVEIFFESKQSQQAKPYKRSTEKTILSYIHEIFHACQSKLILRSNVGELYEPSEEYSYYSTLEGLALERALRANDSASAIDWIKDFLTARRKKRQCMPAAGGRGESENELGEGTATYAELKTLQILQQGYSPLLNSTEDPDYSGFANPGDLVVEYYDRFHAVGADLLATHDRCYMYGCAQAMLLDRFSPSWQICLSKSVTYLDSELGRRFPLSKADQTRSAKRFREIYPAAELRQRCRSAIVEMEQAIRKVRSRHGQKYVIDFEAVDLFPGPASRKPQYSKKTTFYYPKGIGDVLAGRIELRGGDTPAECYGLTRLTLTDTRKVITEKPYSVSFRNETEDGIYLDVQVWTPLFELKAPKLRILDEPGSVTLILLSR